MNLSSWMFSGLAGAIGLVSLVWVVPQLAAPCCPPEGAYVPESETKEKPQAARFATLQVDGMTCASCASELTDALQQLAGVANAKIEYSEKKAVIGYDPKQVTPQTMVDALGKLGYRATLLEDKAGA
jgi:copper chaperone CopZ